MKDVVLSDNEEELALAIKRVNTDEKAMLEGLNLVLNCIFRR